MFRSTAWISLTCGYRLLDTSAPLEYMTPTMAVRLGNFLGIGLSVDRRTPAVHHWAELGMGDSGCGGHPPVLCTTGPRSGPTTASIHPTDLSEATELSSNFGGASSSSAKCKGNMLMVYPHKKHCPGTNPRDIALLFPSSDLHIELHGLPASGNPPSILPLHPHSFSGISSMPLLTRSTNGNNTCFDCPTPLDGPRICCIIFTGT